MTEAPKLIEPQPDTDSARKINDLIKDATTDPFDTEQHAYGEWRLRAVSLSQLPEPLAKLLQEEGESQGQGTRVIICAEAPYENVSKVVVRHVQEIEPRLVEVSELEVTCKNVGGKTQMSAIKVQKILVDYMPTADNPPLQEEVSLSDEERDIFISLLEKMSQDHSITEINLEN